MYNKMKAELMRFIALSKEEDLAIARVYKQGEGTSLRFYAFNKTTFELTERKINKIVFPSGLFPSDKVQITDDGKYMIFKVQWYILRLIPIGLAVVDVEAQTMMIIRYNDQSCNYCTDFGMIDNEMFVAICFCHDEDGQQVTKIYYQIRLYKTKNLQILDTFNITTDQIHGAFIQTNPTFNATFVVHMAYPYENRTQQEFIMFLIKDNKIVQTDKKFKLTEFYDIVSCGKYIIGIFGNQPWHSIIDSANFQVVQKIPKGWAETYYKVQGDLLVIFNDYYSDGMFEIYDLSKLDQPGQQWKIGYLFKDWYYPYFPFGKGKYFYCLFFQENGQYGVEIIDLEKNPTKQMVNYPEWPNQGLQSMISYYHILQEKANSRTSLNSSNQECNKKLYYMGRQRLTQLYLFDDCPPYEHLTKVDLNLNGTYRMLNHNFKVSFDGSYLLLAEEVVGENWRQGYSLDVRPIGELSKTIYRTAMQKPQFIACDINSKGELLYSNANGLFLERMNSPDKTDPFPALQQSMLRRQREDKELKIE